MNEEVDINKMLEKIGNYRCGFGRYWTIKQFYLQFRVQKECCAICGKHQSKLDNLLCIDHDHKTNKDRGLLCRGCNTRLGYYEMRDNLDFEKYLKTVSQRMKEVNTFSILNNLIINKGSKEEIIRSLKKKIEELEEEEEEEEL